MRLQRGEGASICIPNTERKLRIEGKDKFKSAHMCKYVHVCVCPREMEVLPTSFSKSGCKIHKSSTKNDSSHLMPDV